jgi:UDP-glucose 4-epimerase
MPNKLMPVTDGIGPIGSDIVNEDAPKLYRAPKQILALIYTSNVIRGMEFAVEHGLTGVYNLGTDDRFLFSQVADLIGKGLGIDVDPRYVLNLISNSIYAYETRVYSSRPHVATDWPPKISLRDGTDRICVGYTDE